MNLSFTSDSSLTRLIDEDVYLEESVQVCAIEFIEVDMKTTVTTMMKSDTRKLILFSGIIKTPEVIENEKV